MGTIVITTSYPAAAFFYGLLQPNYEIDGKLEKRPWGTFLFRVQPGTHVVAISYPWFFIRRAGKASVAVEIAEGQKVSIHYKASFIRYMPGSISIEGPLPEARVID